MVDGCSCGDGLEDGVVRGAVGAGDGDSLVVIAGGCLCAAIDGAIGFRFLTRFIQRRRFTSMRGDIIVLTLNFLPKEEIQDDFR